MAKNTNDHLYDEEDNDKETGDISLTYPEYCKLKKLEQQMMNSRQNNSEQVYTNLAKIYNTYQKLMGVIEGNRLEAIIRLHNEIAFAVYLKYPGYFISHNNIKVKTDCTIDKIIPSLACAENFLTPFSETYCKIYTVHNLARKEANTILDITDLAELKKIENNITHIMSDHLAKIEQTIMNAARRTVEMADACHEYRQQQQKQREKSPTTDILLKCIALLEQQLKERDKKLENMEHAHTKLIEVAEDLSMRVQSLEERSNNNLMDTYHMGSDLLGNGYN